MNILRALICYACLIGVVVAFVLTGNLNVLSYGMTAASVPAFFLSYAYAMADYLLLIDPKMGPVRALKESRARMKGFKSHLFWLELSFIGWSLLSMVPQLIAMSLLIDISQQTAIVAGYALGIVCSAFVSVYQVVAKTAFFREVENPDDGYAKKRAEQQEYARQMYENMRAEQQEQPAESEPEPVVDEDAARDMFLEYKCSRAAMHEAGVLEEYDAMRIDTSMESRWMREYTDMLIRRFDRDAEILGDILCLAAEYAHTEILDRALMRIDRHVRQQTLPMDHVLGMAGRTLALIRSGRFDEHSGYADRKIEQIADIVSRIEEIGGESETIAKLREMM